MTYANGTSWNNPWVGDGTLFAFNTDSNTLTVLHNFAGGSSDGEYPWGSLTQSGSLLYGMTSWGGTSNKGIIFSFDLNTDALSVLHSFNGSDGAGPSGDLLLSGNTLYGMTQWGGSSNDGVIFSLIVPEPATLSLLALGGLALLRRKRKA